MGAPWLANAGNLWDDIVFTTKELCVVWVIGGARLTGHFEVKGRKSTCFLLARG